MWMDSTAMVYPMPVAALTIATVGVSNLPRYSGLHAKDPSSTKTYVEGLAELQRYPSHCDVLVGLSSAFGCLFG